MKHFVTSLLVATLASFLTLTATAQDKLELPVTASGTSGTVQVTFTLGTLGFLQDVSLKSYCANTGTVTIVDSTLGHTNTIGALAFTGTSQTRISAAWPVQRGDVISVAFTAASVGTNSTVSCWFKNVIK